MRVFALVLAIVLLLPLAPPAGAAVPPAGLLRVPERAVGSPEDLPKWRRVLRRLASEEAVLRACLRDGAACGSARLRAWRRAVRAAGGRPLPEMLERVNRFVNRFRYRPDAAAWGTSDYWATPLEFFDRSGDCEDYAIAKYVTLRLLGVPERAMRLVVLRDTRRDLVHAVLTVTEGHRRLVLDNLYDRVLPEERLPQYRPYYSVNAEGLWKALPTRSGLALDARRLKPARR